MGGSMWSSDPHVTDWANANGYGERQYSFDKLGIRQLRSDFVDNRRGLYLIECVNHEVYIGIGDDIAKRLPDHRTTHPDGKTFRFRPYDAPEPARREIEFQLVRGAQSAGLIVRNREHATGFLGVSTLDELITVDEQSEWLRNCAAVNESDTSALVDLDPSQLAAHHHDFERVLVHPRKREIFAALESYARACIPYPRRTEATFWTVSCYPKSNSARIFCVSMANVETFFVAVTEGSDRIQAVTFVDRRELPTTRVGRARMAMAGARLSPGGHRAGGSFEQRIDINDINDVPRVMRFAAVRRAAASHNLDLMRRRQSAYKSSHCRHLAAAALDLGVRQ